VTQHNIPASRRNSNILKRKLLAEKCRQKNENLPLRSKRGDGAYYISASDISAILPAKKRKLFLRGLLERRARR
jgi:hypothetical protein